MSDDEKDEAELTLNPSANQQQFGITALFWLTFLVGLGIAYLQRMNSVEIVIGGAVGVAIGMGVGFAIGLATKKVPDAVFWATLVAAFAYISVASDPIYTTPHRVLWAVVGAATAAVASTVMPNRFIVNALICAIVAGLILGLYWLVARKHPLDLQIDLIVAPLIGVAVALFVRVLMWLESRRTMPRYVTATWLMVVVIVANLFSRN